MSGIITNLEGVQVQLDGTIVVTSPTILNFNSSHFNVEVDPDDLTKINIQSNQRSVMIGALNEAFTVQSGYSNPCDSIYRLDANFNAMRAYWGFPIRILNLLVAGKAASGTGQVVFTLYKNESPTSLVATLAINATDFTTAEDITHTVDLDDNDFFTMRFDITGTTLARGGSIYMEWLPL